jgi:hypothetical protein
VVEGGDCDGRVLPVPADRSELRFGRGEWHGGDRQIRNDLTVCEGSEFVSRRAGRLVSAGHRLEVEALDQADFLVVHRQGTDPVRPARVASGRVALREGDAVELKSGGEDAIRLVLRRPRRST